MAIAKKKLVEKIEKVYEKFKSRNQSLNMKKIVSKNNTNKISIFKSIFLDLFISDLDKSISSKSIVTARLLTVKKKRQKAKYLSSNSLTCKIVWYPRYLRLLNLGLIEV